MRPNYATETDGASEQTLLGGQGGSGGSSPGITPGPQMPPTLRPVQGAAQGWFCGISGLEPAEGVGVGVGGRTVLGLTLGPPGDCRPVGHPGPGAPGEAQEGRAQLPGRSQLHFQNLLPPPVRLLVCGGIGALPGACPSGMGCREVGDRRQRVPQSLGIACGWGWRYPGASPCLLGAVSVRGSLCLTPALWSLPRCPAVWAEGTRMAAAWVAPLRPAITLWRAQAALPSALTPCPWGWLLFIARPRAGHSARWARAGGAGEGARALWGRVAGLGMGVLRRGMASGWWVGAKTGRVRIGGGVCCVWGAHVSQHGGSCLESVSVFWGGVWGCLFPPSCSLGGVSCLLNPSSSSVSSEGRPRQKPGWSPKSLNPIAARR